MSKLKISSKPPKSRKTWKIKPISRIKTDKRRKLLEKAMKNAN